MLQAQFDEQFENKQKEIGAFRKAILMRKKYARDIKKLITLKRTMRQCSILKKKLQRKDTNLKKIFNTDQQNFITCGTQRGASWSGDTINKTLRLYVVCGQKGYQEVRQQKLPYPSICTLQYHIQDLKFKPGIFEDIFNLLCSKVSTARITTARLGKVTSV